MRRSDFRDAITRLEKAPRKSAASGSRLGRVYTFLGTKGGVGTTTLAVNFAAVLAQRKQQTVLVDLDGVGNDVAMQLGATAAVHAAWRWAKIWRAWTRRCSKDS